MTDTDRTIIRKHQAGVLRTATTTSQVVDPIGATQAMHTRTAVCLKTGTENADTNVVETLLMRVGRKSKAVSYFVSPVSATANATHYTLLSVTKKTAGVDGGVIASWNTHTSAQGAFTSNVPILLVANGTNNLLAVGDTLHFIKRTVGDGRSVGVGPFCFELEEV